MHTDLEGFYVAYLSGNAGQGLVVLVFRKGRIVGADIVGVLFDGEYTELVDGALSISLLVKTPPNVSLRQGGTSGPQGAETTLNFEMPADFTSKKFNRIDGPRGAVNSRFVRLRGLDE